MPIVIKEIIIRTTVEKTTSEIHSDEALIRQLERRVLNRLRDEISVREIIRADRRKNR